MRTRRTHNTQMHARADTLSDTAPVLTDSLTRQNHTHTDRTTHTHTVTHCHALPRTSHTTTHYHRILSRTYTNDKDTHNIYPHLFIEVAVQVPGHVEFEVGHDVARHLVVQLTRRVPRSTLSLILRKSAVDANRVVLRPNLQYALLGVTAQAEPSSRW